MSKARNVVFRNFVFDELLFNLMLTYGPGIDAKEETKDTIKEKLKTTLEEVNKQKPEIINQTREYPPFAYYAVLDYIERTNKLVKFHKCNEEEKRALVEETLVFLNGLVEEIRDTTPGEKNGLLEAGLNLTYKKKKKSENPLMRQGLKKHA